GEFDTIRSTWYGDYIDPMTFLELYVSNSTQNRPRFKNARYDELIEKARFERDPIEREKAFIEAERTLITEQAGLAPLYEREMPILIRPEITGVTRVPTGGYHF